MMGLLPQPSAVSVEVDWLIGSLLGISLLVLGLVFGLMWLFIVRYRLDDKRDRGNGETKTWRIEVAWTAATLVAFFGLFIWSAELFVRIHEPKPDPLTINVIGKQWMWKIEYPGGQREINALHIPVDRNVQLLLTSEDVIHDFGLPDFRIKRDVLPNRLDAIWLNAERPGTYRLFCNQFCGTDHAAMVGSVIVMEPDAYARWLESNGTSQDLVADGHALFIRYGCDGCHQNGLSGGGGTVRAPSLNGLFMSPVPLEDGQVVIADDRYLYDSIVFPQAQVVASYQPLMPSFARVIPEADLLRIVAYIKSLGSQVRADRP
jgi:cytochrome c oxidase subunit 2